MQNILNLIVRDSELFEVNITKYNNKLLNKIPNSSLT